MFPRLTLSALLLIGFALTFLRAHGADRGMHPHYFPLVQEGIVLPDMPLLLVTGPYEQPYPMPRLELISPDATQRWRLSPDPVLSGASVSPNGRTVLFTERSGFRQFAMNLNGTNVREVPLSHTAQWSPDSSATLLQSDSDQNGWRLSFTPVDGTQQTVALDSVYESYGWSADGRAIVYAADRVLSQDLYRFDRDSMTDSLFYYSPGRDYLLGPLPDGRWLAMSQNGTNFDVVRLDANGTNPLALFYTIRSPLSTYIDPDPTARFLFLRGLPGAAAEPGVALYTVDGEPVWTLTEEALCLPIEPYHGCGIPSLTWRPDGEEIAFVVSQLIDETKEIYSRRLLIMRTDGSESAPRELVEEGANDPAFSPDGRYLAYEYAFGAFYGADVRIIDLQTGHVASVDPAHRGVSLSGWVVPPR